MESNQQQLSIEDVTVMKLMEEIVEFDQEIKMKQKWINTRVKLLHQIQSTQQQQAPGKMIINDFLQQIQPDYPEKMSVEYTRPGQAIPMPMGDVYKDAIPLSMAEKYPTIPMKNSETEDFEVLAEPMIEEVK